MALEGTEILQVQGIAGNGMPSGQTFQTTTGEIADLAALTSNNEVATALNTVGAGTITAAGIVGMVTVRGGAQVSAAFTDTTATAALITAALPDAAAVGTSFRWTYVNNTNAPATISGGSNVTVSVITVVPPNSYATWLVTRDASTTYTFVGVQQGYFPHGGTYTSIGTAPVTVSDTNVTTYSQISFTLRSVGGTIVGYPVVTSMIPGTSFAVRAGTTDLSVYNYNILG